MKVFSLKPNTNPSGLRGAGAKKKSNPETFSIKSYTRAGDREVNPLSASEMDKVDKLARASAERVWKDMKLRGAAR